MAENQNIEYKQSWHDEYPVPAVREMILNALIHRNYLGVHTQLRVYNDRLMMWNDGTLPYDISEEDLKTTHMSKPRNTLIAYACKANNMPEPEMRNEQGGFVTIFHKQNVKREPQKVPDLNERQKKAIEYVKEHGKITRNEYENLFNVSSRTAIRDLDHLVKNTVFGKQGINKNSHYVIIEA